MKLNSPQFELPGAEQVFNLSGEVLKQPKPAPTWNDVEQTRDLFTGPQSQIDQSWPSLPEVGFDTTRPVWRSENESDEIHAG